MSNKRTLDITLVVTTLLTALLAGTYFGFATGVMPALHHVDDHVFVATQLAINKHIQNPLFILVFLGGPLLSLVLGWTERGEQNTELKRWLLVAVALSVIGLVISFAANIPLNDKFDKHHDRSDFEDAWVVWNAIRAFVTTASLGCFLRALLLVPRR
jgi:uncharacterized membrane protein